ncbi:MAG: dihydroorotase [Flavobacteriaceae bacterium]
MKILLKKATIIDSKGAYHLKEVDIFIVNGRIQEIGKQLTPQADKVIQKDNLHLSTGWFDSSVCFGEPGYEERETLKNGLRTAALSGFTDIALEPETPTHTQTQSAVVQLKTYSSIYPTAIHPIAAFTQERAGKQLTEFHDLQTNGAVAFGDFLQPIENPELLKTALLYAQRFNGLILSTPMDKSIGAHGVAHEGNVSTALGLTGIPSLNETLQIQRDIAILTYTGGRLHIPCISSAQSVALIREAKKEGLKISCSVALANLTYTEEALKGFDTRFKLLPPLRHQNDCDALKEGLLDGTIDMVSSHHQPLNSELKQVEFEHAHTGTIGLEAMFGILNTLFPLDKTIHLLTQGRSIFGLQSPIIAQGEEAHFTLFNPDSSTTLGPEHLFSSSKNCAFIGHAVQGKVYGTIRGDKFLFS